MEFPGSNHQVPEGLGARWICRPRAMTGRGWSIESRRDFLSLAREFIPAGLSLLTSSPGIYCRAAQRAEEGGQGMEFPGSNHQVP